MQIKFKLKDVTNFEDNSINITVEQFHALSGYEQDNMAKHTIDYFCFYVEDIKIECRLCEATTPTQRKRFTSLMKTLSDHNDNKNNNKTLVINTFIPMRRLMFYPRKHELCLEINLKESIQIILEENNE